MTTLNLYDRPAQGTAARYNLNGMFSNWRRTKRAIGGYHLGSFEVVNLGMPQLTDFYNTWIGMKIVENTFGITSYEGIIWQLDLIKNGVNYRRTLNPNYWHNNVQVIYTDGPGDKKTIAWSENINSTEIFGNMEYTMVIGGASSAGATALRDRELVDYAWPKSRTVGSVSVGEPSPTLSGDGLYVTTAGFWSTANWQYLDTSITYGASAMMSALASETEIIIDGRLETNALSVTVDGAMIPIRLGDAMENVIKQGDASGNVWKGGVYADLKLVYEPAPTTIDYILRDGALYDKAGVKVDPALINPGFYIRDTNAPMGMQPPGTSNIFDDPQVSYCDEVEFLWPDTLKLSFPGESMAIVALGPVWTTQDDPYSLKPRWTPQDDSLSRWTPPPPGPPIGDYGQDIGYREDRTYGDGKIRKRGYGDGKER